MPEEACLVGICHPTSSGIFINRFLADAVDFRVRGIRMNEYESADAGVRNHRATVQQRDPKSFRSRQKPENIPLQRVVRAT